MFFFFKQKTAYDMRISDWSSDVCSSDLEAVFDLADAGGSNFSGANLTKSRWRGSRVFGVEIYNALNQRTGKTVFPRFDGADLTGADLRGAGLEGIDFTGVTLTGANLSGADLSN